MSIYANCVDGGAILKFVIRLYEVPWGWFVRYFAEIIPLVVAGVNHTGVGKLFSESLNFGGVCFEFHINRGVEI